MIPATRRRRRRKTRGRVIASASFAMLESPACAGVGAGCCPIGGVADTVVTTAGGGMLLVDELVGVRDVAVSNRNTSLSVLCQTTRITSA